MHPHVVTECIPTVPRQELYVVISWYAAYASMRKGGKRVGSCQRRGIVHLKENNLLGSTYLEGLESRPLSLTYERS